MIIKILKIIKLVRLNIKNLTCISNNAGVDDFGLGLLLQKKQIDKMLKHDLWLNAEEALSYGLVDEIYNDMSL